MRIAYNVEMLEVSGMDHIGCVMDLLKLSPSAEMTKRYPYPAVVAHHGGYLK